MGNFFGFFEENKEFLGKEMRKYDTEYPYILLAFLLFSVESIIYLKKSHDLSGRWDNSMRNGSTGVCEIVEQ